MEKALEQHRSDVYFGVEGLVEAATEIIRQFNAEPRDGKQLEYPNIRTLRYYITEGLLPAPTEKRGQSSLFRYRHLISLLVIKWFQAQGLPISVIQEAIRNMTVDQLENAFGDRVMVFTDRSRVDSFIAAEGREEGEDLVVLGDPRTRNEYLQAETRDEETKKKNSARGYLERLLNKSREPKFSRPAPAGVSMPLYSSAEISLPVESEPGIQQPRNSGTGGLWRRIVVAEGLEVNIENSFEAPQGETERRALIQKLETLISRRF